MTKPDPEEARSVRRRLFEQRVERLMNRLYGTALRLTRDPTDAEDVVAEAVGRAWSRLDDLRDMEQLDSWLFRILNNTFISMCRRRRCRQDMEVQPTDDGESDTSDPGDFSLFRQLHQPFLLWWGTPEEQFLNGVLKADIQRALDALPEAFRVAVVLVDIQGHTYDEAATVLDVPLGTVRSRLNRGRGLLQKGLWEQAQDAGLVDRPREDRVRPEGGHR